MQICFRYEIGLLQICSHYKIGLMWMCSQYEIGLLQICFRSYDLQIVLQNRLNEADGVLLDKTNSRK